MADSARDTICEGCGSLFTSAGYSRHLATTTIQECRSIYERADEYIPGREDRLGNINPPSPASSPDFQGDFFGRDYSPADFDEVTSPQSQDSEVDEPVTSGNIDFDDVPPWEPPVDDRHPEHVEQGPRRETQPADGPIDNEVESQMSDETRRCRTNTDNTTRYEPYKIAFPPRLGQPGVAINRGLGSTEYEISRNSFEQTEAGPGNPYAPFASQIDWEFAKWAKLRGPGSTAVTELLALEGVSSYTSPKHRSYKLTNCISDCRETQPFVQEFCRAQQDH